MAVSPSGLRVFVVDDEFLIASTIAMILRHEGFDATSFSLPLEALRAAQAAPPDVLISDMVMPLLSGLDLALQVQQLNPNCKIVLFSGQATTVNLLKAATPGARDFEVLVKPVHPADLLRRIQTHLKLAS